MKQAITNMPALTIGIDLGDRWSHLCGVDIHGEVSFRRRVRTTREGFSKGLPTASCRLVIEVGCHSPWVSRLLDELGHEVLVANPRQLKLIYKDARKNDRQDAEYLARLGRMDPSLLCPIRHRDESTQRDRALMKARDALVRARSSLISHIRGIVKSLGHRIGSSSAESFTKKARLLPENIFTLIGPILTQIENLNKEIAIYDKQIAHMVKEKYPEAQCVSQITGVGPITSLAFVLAIEDPARFSRSREVGPYFGLVPKKQESGNQSPQLRITKAGDPYVRQLLVGAAQYILGPFGPPCDLRRYGENICAHGGKNAKKRAVVAVARKLAVVMHGLWVTGEVYDPDRTLRRSAAKELRASEDNRANEQPPTVDKKPERRVA